MIRLGDPLKLHATNVFFSVPLAQARVIAARVAATVLAQRSSGNELLDGKGNEVLRAALGRELPRLSTNNLLTLAAEVNGTAHMIAAVEWRNAGHRPGDTPEVGLSTLEAGVLIHLHASPESVPAQICAATWTEHAELYKHRFMRPPNPTKQAMGRWAQLSSEHQKSMYEYWQELLNRRDV